MPHPMTHLCVADRVLSRRSMPDEAAASFLLGSIAPDALHYREVFIKAEKKITHLCPESDELWGYVTENEKWEKCVLNFLQREGAADPFIQGYCNHILTDIYNNKVLWSHYRNTYPDDAAKGYNGEYHNDWAQIDAKLYQSLAEDNPIKKLMPLAAARTLPGLVTAEEIDAIRHNVIYVSYPNKPPAILSLCKYISYETVLEMIDKAADWALELLFDVEHPWYSIV